MAAKTLLQLAREAEHRFWPKVDRRGPDECWPWLAGARGGLGGFNVGSSRSEKRSIGARLVAWMLANDRDPGDMFVANRCQNRLCCNPRHLHLAAERPRSRKALVDRFFEKVDSSGGPDACHLWTGALDGKGYGQLSNGSRLVGAHRIAMLLAGENIDGCCVLHRCDNPPCVNPRHLFLGTQGDNVRDMHLKGRANTPEGERAGRAKLTCSEVLVIRQRFAAGETRRQLANEFGVSPGTITRACNEGWRSAGGPTRTKSRRPRLTPDQDEDLRRALNRGERQIDVAARYGISRSYARYIANGRTAGRKEQ